MDEAVDGGEVGDGRSLSLLTTRIVNISTGFHFDGGGGVLDELRNFSVWNIRGCQLDSVSDAIWSNRCQTVWPRE